MTPVPITVAFPLYRSARFVDNIAANIDRLTYPNLEVLISDRHGDDDAVVRLGERYARDPRVRILARDDRAGWVTHYNDLLREARGTYFCWMPHDDRYEPGYIDALAGALDRNPGVLLAFGVMQTEAQSRPVPVPRFTPPPVRTDEPASPRLALRLLLGWELSYVVRGLFRRDVVLRQNLFLPETRKGVFADICWAFAMALAGPMRFVPSAICCKRFYEASTSADWRFDARQSIDELRVMSRALTRSPHARREVWPAVAMLGALAAGRVTWRTIRPLVGQGGRRVPERARSLARSVAGRVLAPRARPAVRRPN